MFCRGCGKEVKQGAIACPGCGVPPLVGSEHCQECGAQTKAEQVMCTSCGCKLRMSGGSTVAGMSTGVAILWCVCCYPVGFVKLNQGLKGLIWFGLMVITFGFAFLPMAVDFFMCNGKAIKTGTLGEWEWFPRA